MNNFYFVKKGLNGLGEFVEETDWDDNFTSNDDWYRSTYFYDKKALVHYEKTKSLKGYRDVKSNKIWFDFDGDLAIDDAKNDAIEVINRLKKSGIKETSISIYFSGGRGFHVVTQLDKMFNRTQIEHLTLEIFGKGLKTLDYSLYDENQILRLVNTRHPDSKLYKVQITENQLITLNCDEIKDYAEIPQPVYIKDVSILDDKLLTIPEPVKEIIPVNLNFNVVSSKPHHWKDYKWYLLNAYKVLPEERTNSLMVIAATCKGLGYDRSITEAMCLSFDTKFCSNTGKPPVTDLERTLDSVFSDEWAGGQYSYKNNKWLQQYCERVEIEVNKFDEDQIVNIYDIKDQYIDFVKNIDKNTIKTGIKCLDDALPITIGNNLGIVGAASSGKTALAVEILKNTSEAGVISVFASLDMHRNRLMEKLLFKVSNLSREELYKRIQNGTADDLFEKLKKEYKNVYFYDRSCPSVGDIKKYIRTIEKETGLKVKLVMIDYFERVNGEKSDETAASKEVAGQLQDIINDFDVAMITLVQPNKFSLNGGPDSPITSYTAIKGSSFLYQSFRSIISIWRPFFTPETKHIDKYLQMAILKNDLGELDLFTFKWDGKKGEIKEFASDEEETTFNNLMAEKEKKKNKDDDPWN